MAVLVLAAVLLGGPGADAAPAAEWLARYEANQADLVLYLPLDEGRGDTALDPVNGLAADVRGAQWAPGFVPGQPLVFDGASGSFPIPDPRAESGAGRPFTVEAWCEPAIDDGRYLVLKKHEFGFPCFSGKGKVAAYLHGEAGKDWVTEAPGLCVPGEWQHYVMTYDQGAVRLYRNGALAKEAKAPLLNHSSEPIHVGTCAGYGDRDFAGKVGLIRLYSAALSGPEIAAEHESLRRGAGPQAHAAVALQLPPFLDLRPRRGDAAAAEKQNTALEFDGRASCVAVSATAERLDPPDALTVGAWIRPENTLPRQLAETGYIVSRNAANRAGYALGTTYQNGLHALLATDAGCYDVSAPQVLRRGVWQHVAFSWDGEAIQLFVDGSPVGQAVLTTGRLRPYDGPLTLGRAAHDTSCFFHGAIDDVRVLQTAMGVAVPAGTGDEVIAAAVNDDPGGVIGPRSRHLEGLVEQRRPLVDFEDLSGWTVSGYRNISSGALTRSREQRLWGSTVGKVEYRAGSFLDPAKRKVVLKPPQPLAIPEPFDAINLWVFASNWVSEPRGTRLSLEVSDAQGKIHALPMESSEHPHIFWTGWYLLHRSLPETVPAPATLLSLTFHNFLTDTETLYIDSLDVYRRDQGPVAAQIPSWQDCGFPTTPDTILPSLAQGVDYANTVARDGNAVVLAYRGTDETIVYRYEAQTGTLSDLTATRTGGISCQPAHGGGWVLDQDGTEVLPEDPRLGRRLEHLAIEGNTVKTLWQWRIGELAFTSSLVLTIRQKSLIVDLDATTTAVKELRCGTVAGIPAPRVIVVPYLVMRSSLHPSQDPGILHAQGAFLSCFLDWFHSGASELFGEHGTSATADGAQLAILNGGAAYHRKTDGTRNPPHERLFITLSSRLAEVLPNVPNPPNPWNEVTRSKVWATRMWYAPKLPYPTWYNEEYALWEKVRHYEVRDLCIRHHANLYRVYAPAIGDPYTMVTDTEPGLGGDAACAEMIRQTRKLGYRVGFYTNYTLLPPLSYRRWDENAVALTPSGDWRYGSLSAVLTKPARILGLQRQVGTELKRRFGLDCSYLDQYTCPPLWRHTDYDVRVEGAGQFGPALRVLARSLREEARIFAGPVLSEGISQWFLAGFCDSYAQPGEENQDTLVDFQLRKLHLLSNDCGFALGRVSSNDPKDIDHLLAAEIAYGHIGHLGGRIYHGAPRTITDWLGLLRSYFMIRQLQEHYANVPVAEIGYHDGSRLLTSEEAIAADALAHNQVHLKYDNGLDVYVNRHRSETWLVRLADQEYLLPPDGWVASLPGTIIEYSVLAEGRRVDLVSGAAYTYANGGGATHAFGPITAAQSYVVQPEGDVLWLIPAPFAKAETVHLDLAALAPALAAEAALELVPCKDDGTPCLDSVPLAAVDGRVAVDVDERAFKVRVQRKRHQAGWVRDQETRP